MKLKMNKNKEKASEIIAEIMWSEVMGLHWNYRVYIPKEYGENLDKNYPTLYVLHGWGGNLTNTSDETRIDSKSVLDNLIDNKEIKPMIVVFVDGFNSFYVDGPTFKMKSAIVKDLIPFIDSQYRTLSNKSSRAIAGISMGGYGALNIALSNSEIFASIGLMSPAIWDKPDDNPIYGTPLLKIYYDNFYKSLIEEVSDRDIEIFAYHGEDDEVISYKNVDNFISFARDKGFKVQYELKEVGPHNWETWREMYPKVLKDISNSFNR